VVDTTREMMNITSLLRVNYMQFLDGGQVTFTVGNGGILGLHFHWLDIFFSF
jgi:hypothetical protein